VLLIVQLFTASLWLIKLLTLKKLQISLSHFAITSSSDCQRHNLSAIVCLWKWLGC